jgi:FAD/FMN-containing dehydrogenase
MNQAGVQSWGNHPPFFQTAHVPHWLSEIGTHIGRLSQEHGSTLAFGSGRSYGDSCLAASDQVLDCRQLNRFIKTDWSTGVVAAESGVTLEAILALAVPMGWFLSVTPGTKYVTLGGAIANDVHGKNHHRRGTFGCHVRQFSLWRSDSGRVECSPTKNIELFQATIGGLGLTGIIEWAEIQLVPIRSSRLDTYTQRFGSLDEFFALSTELDEQYEFCVSWIDCCAQGTSLGRGVYMAGDFANDGPLLVEGGRKLTVPCTPPVSVFNRLTLRTLNEAYWRKAPRNGCFRQVDYESFFYPLDAILKWNRIYGPRGFQQYQVLIPEAHAKAGIHAMLTAIAQSGIGSFLAVLKRCGNIVSPGWMSFPQPGTTLALDFPQTSQLELTLFPKLDAIVRAYGGRLYPAKDAHMISEDFQHSYKHWRRLEALRDPVLLSRFWKRVMK